MARLTALQLYRYLPAKNCGKCDEATCMAFAMKLIERESEACDCPELTEEGKKKLIDVLTPPVRCVEIGTGENAIKIGGEEVMYRHELRFFNPTALFTDISDLMDDKEIKKRINFVNEFEIDRIGQKLRLNGIAIRSASNDPEKFKSVVEKVTSEFSGAIVLCSFDPDVLSSAMEVVSYKKPLLYAANEENLERVLEIAQKYSAPLAVCEQDLSKLGTIAKELSARNFNDIILDPGIEWGGFGLGRTLNKAVMIRKSALKGVKELGYPVMASTLAIRMNPGNSQGNNDNNIGAGGDNDNTTSTGKNNDRNKTSSRDAIAKLKDDKMMRAYYESTIASMLVDRFASLLITHSIDMWSLLPLVTLRQNIYADPRVEPTADAKLYEVGNPDENSPLFITTNFAMTYFSVIGDMENAKISCYLLVIDTEGLGVLVSVAADKLTASGIQDSIEKYAVKDKIKHNKLILPGAAARLKGDVEDATGFEVIVGPQDSSQIYDFLKKNW